MLNPDDFRFPSIEALQAFEAAARLGTFERAAELLSITGSAASKRVSGLEGMLGVSLLQRDGRSLALTSHGREYLEQIAPILAQLAAVPLHRRQVQRQQRLTLRTPPTFARQILIPRLASFAEACPEIELEILLSSPSDGQDLPLADVEVRGDSHGVAAGERLLEERVLPMAAPGLLLGLPRPWTPAMLAGLPSLRSPLEPWQPWFRVAGLDWPEPCAGPRLLDLGMTLEAAANGQGVALARPCWRAPGLPRGGWWCCSRCVRRPPTITTCAATRPRRPASVSPPGWRRSAARRWPRAGNSFRRRTTETAEFPSADADNYSACGGTSRSTIQPPPKEWTA
ncbi:LysR family transcriptional regulator [Pseudomonas aeruginosa]|nr:LysR family transcriptional regulator [Pseudomonas aeruginosa]